MVEGIWYDFPSWDKDTESLWALPNGGLEIKHQIVVRGDWLEAIGASLPTTVEEYAEVARQFTFDDPDGNGQKDTWGLATSATSAGNWTNNLATFLAAFGYEHIERPYLDLASGEIMLFEVTEGWRDFLRWMNGLWEAGVIGPVASGAASCRRPGRPFAATSGERPPGLPVRYRPASATMLQRPAVQLR